jgi:hypothetical protein
MTFVEYCKKLEAKIIDSYESGVTIDAAERLAGEFLSAMIRVSDELKVSDLDSRMKKSGVKSIRAAIYTDAKSKPDVKLTEAAVEHLINLNNVVQNEQISLDKAEVDRDSLERYYNIFKEAHLHYRSISKGRFDG